MRIYQLIVIALLFGACTNNNWDGVYEINKRALEAEMLKSLDTQNPLAAKMGIAMAAKFVDNADLFISIKKDSIYMCGNVGDSGPTYIVSSFSTIGDSLKYKRTDGTEMILLKNDSGIVLMGGNADFKLAFSKVKKENEPLFATKLQERKIEHLELEKSRIEKEKERQLLEGLISIAIIRKANYEQNYRNYLIFELKIKNNSEQPIKAFSGQLTISDLLDNELKSFSWTNDDGIPGSSEVIKSVQIDFSEYNTRETLIRDKPLDKLVFKWVTNKALLEDGTRLSD